MYGVNVTYKSHIITQPDGKSIRCFVSGDEYFNWAHDKNGYTLIQSQNDGFFYYGMMDGDEVIPSTFLVGSVIPAVAGLTPWAIISKDAYLERRSAFWENIDRDVRDAPTHGIINNLNIYIRFSDQSEFADPRSQHDQLFNDPEGPSLLHYFEEVSYDTLHVHTHHYPECDFSTNYSYQDEHPRSYYMPHNASTNPNGYTDSQRAVREQTLLRNAVESIADEVPASLIIDSNDDGYVDNVTFLVRGSPTAWATLLWPHRWSLYYYNVYINGKLVGDYNFNLEQGGYFTVGTLCHEFFHSLGAPDLYHYDAPGAPTAVGGWDVMDGSGDPPQYMGAFMKYKYGDWIEEIPTITSSGTYELNPLQSSTNNIFKINSPNSSTEYFVVEYRKKEGIYESQTPGNDSGLLVYRINTTVGNGNADGPPDEIYLYRVGGTLTDNGSFPLAPFNQSSGRTEINDNTNPSSFLTWGDPGGLNIIDVSDPGLTIQFSYVTVLLMVELLDIVGDTDEDGIINPGEEFSSIISIENSSNEIQILNVLATVSSDNDIIFPEPQINFGDIPAGGIEAQELLISIPLEHSLGDVTFDLLITGSFYENGVYSSYSDEVSLTFEVSLNQSGWPVLTINQIESSPAVIDIDGDGSTEVIYGDYEGLLHMVDEMGNEQQGFPVDLEDDIWGSPAVADLEGDGDMEIVIGSKDEHLLIINSDGTIQADYNAHQYIMATPALGDIDGDGDLEVVFGGYSSPGKLFAVNPDGSAVSGFPIELGEKIQRGVALADFSGDGLVDIVVGTDDEMIHVIYGDGTEAPGFPFEADNDFRTAPSVIDINGEKVILAGSRDDNFYGINSDGSLRFVVETGADVSTSAGFGPTLSGVGIFFGSDDGYVYGVDLNGNALSGWPQYVEDDVICSPAVVDLDGDGEVEIVTAVDGPELYAFHLDGSFYHHFPMHYGDFPFKGSPAVVDLDGDGDLEIMIGTARSIVSVDVKETSNSEGYWNIYRGDLKRAGYYEGIATGDMTVEVSHMSDWNLVGLPVGLVDTELMSVYPDAIEGTLFSFTDSYLQQDELFSGTGYWLRFDQEGTNSLTGTPITVLTLSLQSDWNLMSGLSTSMGVSEISDPEGIIIPGTIFGFGESYELTDVIEPGKAYWLRTTQSGEVILGGSTGSRVKEIPQLQANTIRVKGMTLYFGAEVSDKLQYSLPPLPPEGVFDIRFSDDSRICAEDCEIDVRHSSEGMEIECGVVDDQEWELVDEWGNVTPCSGIQQIDGGSQRFILQRSSDMFPLTYSIAPAYPNPFNPETTIRFSLPEVTELTITIHDILGRQVVELVRGELESGHHSLRWDGTDAHNDPVSAGVYFVQINSVEYTHIMKLIFLK